MSVPPSRYHSMPFASKKATRLIKMSRIVECVWQHSVALYDSLPTPHFAATTASDSHSGTLLVRWAGVGHWEEGGWRGTSKASPPVSNASTGAS